MIDMREYLRKKLSRIKPSEQQFISAAREERIYWRGEDIETFKRIYEQTQRMRLIGPKKYREESIIRLKQLIAKMA